MLDKKIYELGGKVFLPETDNATKNHNFSLATPEVNQAIAYKQLPGDSLLPRNKQATHITPLQGAR